MRKLPRILAVVALAWCLGAQAAPKVAVSIPPQKTVVDAVSGGSCEVLVLVGAGRDPHVFEPTPRQLQGLRGRPLYFTIGLPFEQVLADKLQKINPAMRFVAMAEADAAEHAHEHGAACDPHEDDPHVWMSPDRLAEQAVAVAAALSALDTTNAARYAAGAADFAAKAAALKAGLAERLRKAGATTVAVYHPAWGHFAEAFGLEQIAVESHGQSPGARHLADFEKKVRERGVKTMLVQNEAERRRVAAFARKCGLRTVVVDPLAADVLGTLRATADALCGADAGAKPAAP
ncbi:MAG: zinc ABC transporter substrate-binding protein [Kiritimatiellae bacterium]|nr:zinc ABC transporter substrate-binding protein [Kiritimatiellia bacterium]